MKYITNNNNQKFNQLFSIVAPIHCFFSPQVCHSKVYHPSYKLTEWDAIHLSPSAIFQCNKHESFFCTNIFLITSHINRWMWQSYRFLYFRSSKCSDLFNGLSWSNVFLYGFWAGIGIDELNFRERYLSVGYIRNGHKSQKYNLWILRESNICWEYLKDRVNLDFVTYCRWTYTLCDAFFLGIDSQISTVISIQCFILFLSAI